MNRALAHLAVPPASILASFWIRARQRRYRNGQPLTPDERRSLAGYFTEDLLSAIRVSRIHRIAPALPPRLIRALRLPASMDISRVAAMSYGDIIVLSGQERRFPNPRALLFHEMVHSVQYRILGLRRFLRCYIRGWVDADYDYFRIPLEEQAFDLQDRFVRGESFDVEALLRDALSGPAWK